MPNIRFPFSLSALQMLSSRLKTLSLPPALPPLPALSRLRTLSSPLLLPALLVLVTACSPPRTLTAIQNVTVIDAESGVRLNQTVIFNAEGITAVQPASMPFDDTEMTEVIDGTGKYLIPGLWDFHVHLTYDERLTETMPELFLAWGVTSVRDTGGLMHKILPVVKTMRAKGAVSPRVFFAGPLLDGEYVVYNGVGRPEIGVSVPTPEDARRIVASLAEQGVDFVKAYEMLTPETFTALVDAAAAAGLPVDSHVPLSMRARTAGPMADAVEHLRNIEMDCGKDAEAFHGVRLERLRNPDQLSGFELRASLHSLQRLPAIDDYAEEECGAVIAALAEAGTAMVPTLRLVAYGLKPSHASINWRAALAGLPESVRADWLGQAAELSALPAEDLTFPVWSLYLIGLMNQVGAAGAANATGYVPIAAGTDTPILLGIPGYSLHEELELLVRAGLSTMEALEAATLVPARWFGIEDSLGTVAVGKQADLVLLDADPLADIRNTKRIARVVSKGAVVER